MDHPALQTFKLILRKRNFSLSSTPTDEARLDPMASCGRWSHPTVSDNENNRLIYMYIGPI